MKDILNYFTYPSTWKGIIGIAAALGLTFNIAQQEAVIAAALALIGVIQVFIDDNGDDVK